CETLQISAASPVVKTVFMTVNSKLSSPGASAHGAHARLQPDAGHHESARDQPAQPVASTHVGQAEKSHQPGSVNGLLHLSHLTIGGQFRQLEECSKCSKVRG